MAFSCQLVIYQFYTRDYLYYSFFRGINFIFETRSLYSFTAKVLRVLFQLQSPDSEHRNSSYVRNNPDYSMFKTEIRIWLAHGPNWSEFSGNLEPELTIPISLGLILLEVYFNWPLESLKSDKK